MWSFPYLLNVVFRQKVAAGAPALVVGYGAQNVIVACSGALLSRILVCGALDKK
jgi:hypothetical protein